ncbi:Spo0B domain-containing protein [Paenibacillus sp. sptzw28]|uniref:Spo0B domain-containing protein n=1 Tax=Paenibacillus sp. sptzw28 TaxID=715179 RepID=UPI001C6E6B0F|nr:Spo0B domain-containing protein [Paenibacillus sp. sptzw28]QYR23392.1 Spo0B domain-containing protein [Paenibacillus sp. sptzw28]
MNRFRTTKQYGAVSVLLPAAAAFIWRSEFWFFAVFTVWIIAAAALWVWCERKEQAVRMARTIHALQTVSVQTLNHHRHDWMNDLQVLYGYIRMQKADKTVQYVEQIRERMMTESKIAKLGIPSLVTFLQSFRTLTHSVELDIEIDGDLNIAELPINGERAAETVVEIINAYRFAVKQGTGEAAKLLLDLSYDEKTMTVSFHYDGGLKDMNEWKQKCKRALKGSPLKLSGSGLQPDNMALQVEFWN